jgi:hypothetical protein
LIIVMEVPGLIMAYCTLTTHLSSGHRRRYTEMRSWRNNGRAVQLEQNWDNLKLRWND